MATHLKALLCRSDRLERGAAMVEYALLLALVSVICLVSMAFLGRELSQSFDDSGQDISVVN
jgi:Flp pilus assembly pilin Flp